MKQPLSNCLAASSTSRSVHLLPNKQVELSWDQITVAMQMADLLILHNAVQAWMETVEREWVKVYRLSLNDCVLFIEGNDIHRFCAMVQEAAEQLPRRTVRWADLTVQIAPYTADQLTNIGCFSCN